MKIGHLPWRDLWGFSTVDSKGTTELISGEKLSIAILSNLHVYFVVRLPDYIVFVSIVSQQHLYIMYHLLLVVAAGPQCTK